jgi:TonB family protein
MPVWAPTNPALRFFSATGAIEIVIDESGAVEQARMLKRTQAAYDDALLRAARTWQYTPARKGTQPVRYRHVLEVTVRPPG